MRSIINFFKSLFNKEDINKEVVEYYYGFPKGTSVAECYKHCNITCPTTLIDKKVEDLTEDDEIWIVEPIEEAIGTQEAGEWNHEVFDYDAIWDTPEYGGGTLVVLDNGVIEHESINVLGRENFANDNKGAHGTHVSGCSQAKKYGTNPKGSVYDIQVLSAAGSGSSFNVRRGMQWFADQDDIKVMNVSLGSPFMSNSQKEILLDILSDNTKWIFCAAGNAGWGDGSNTDSTSIYPANWASDPDFKGKNIFSVGASKNGNGTKEDVKMASFSSIGTVSFASAGQSILAPISLVDLARYSGTSMATPVFSGLFTGILEMFKNANKQFTNSNFHECVAASAYSIHDGEYLDGKGQIDYKKFLEHSIRILKSDGGTIPSPVDPEPNPGCLIGNFSNGELTAYLAEQGITCKVDEKEYENICKINPFDIYTERISTVDRFISNYNNNRGGAKAFTKLSIERADKLLKDYWGEYTKFEYFPDYQPPNRSFKTIDYNGEKLAVSNSTKGNIVFYRKYEICRDILKTEVKFYKPSKKRVTIKSDK